MADSYITWSHDELEQMLNSPEGLVGKMLEDLASRATVVAKAAAPTQKPENYSWGKKRSTSYMPWSGGYTKARVSFHPSRKSSATYSCSSTISQNTTW